ncbi:MAG TPA: PfkB family carbohydrate kinase, partial [Chthoniobacteraceae bacterium]|nr:PfkB family carbohydrate kinase [Chthoniobacteraceae bacterium]
LNYRPALWQNSGGAVRAREVNLAIVPRADVVFGHDGHFDTCLGIESSGNVEESMARLVEKFPNVRIAAATLRKETSATRNDWGAVCMVDGRFYKTPVRATLEILDRVGGGDSFASGFIYGFLQFGDPQKAIAYGAAHGALAMTTPGDNSMASLAEVEALASTL